MLSKVVPGGNAQGSYLRDLLQGPFAFPLRFCVLFACLACQSWVPFCSHSPHPFMSSSSDLGKYGGGCHSQGCHGYLHSWFVSHTGMAPPNWRHLPQAHLMVMSLIIVKFPLWGRSFITSLHWKLDPVQLVWLVDNLIIRWISSF